MSEVKKAKPTTAKPVAKKTATTAKPATASAKKTATTAKPATAKQPSLPKSLFDIKVNSQAVFDAIMSERASRRQGTHSTKTRGEVRGGGKRPWRQKGTGNARQGSIRSPQWVGGGVVWGPRPDRNYKLKVNKKVKKLAFASALTLKAKDKAILVNDFAKFSKPSTKKIIQAVDEMKLKKTFKKIIIVTNDDNIWKSASNVPNIFATRFSNLTVESIVNADVLVFGKKEIEFLERKDK